MTDELRAKIDAIVKSKRVVVFMKGSAMMPMCGFSAAALHALKTAGAKDLATFNVLQDPAVREGLKEYSGWPTIPQVFVDGKLVGGSDIVKEMQESGELAQLLENPQPAD